MAAEPESIRNDEQSLPRENFYRCPKCNGLTVTVDIDGGVTPFMLNCRASGREGDCDGMAISAMYPKGPRPSHIPEPAWEWFKPTGKDYAKLSPAMKEHVDRGGLDIRKRGGVGDRSVVARAYRLTDEAKGKVIRDLCGRTYGICPDGSMKRLDKPLSKKKRLRLEAAERLKS